MGQGFKAVQCLLVLALVLLGGTYSWENGHATTQGRRAYQEDRLLAVPDLKLSNSTRVGLFAVFDGHIGSQASHFLVSNFENQLRMNLEGKDLEQAEVLKTGLKNTILELEDMFIQKAVKNRWPAGSTASVVLLTDKHTVLGNVGDSSIVGCSPGQSSEDPRLYPMPLTHEHHPLDPEEKDRIERAGGVIYEGGLIDGHFPMSRAIGDVPMKRHGVIATPSVSSLSYLRNWYLVVASDGLYEGNGVSVATICDLARKVQGDFSPGEAGLTQAIADNALDVASHTSRDNISLVVVFLN